jgi:tRNA modification GTPase
VVQSKVDLGARGAAGALATSARTGEGLAALRAQILATAGAGLGEAGDDAVVVTSERQRSLLARAGVAMARTAAGLAGGVPAEVVAVDAREALAALAAVTGEAVGEEVLDAVFARFCIGK